MHERNQEGITAEGLAYVNEERAAFGTVTKIIDWDGAMEGGIEPNNRVVYEIGQPIQEFEPQAQ